MIDDDIIDDSWARLRSEWERLRRRGSMLFFSIRLYTKRMDEKTSLPLAMVYGYAVTMTEYRRLSPEVVKVMFKNIKPARRVEQDEALKYV